MATRGRSGKDYYGTLGLCPEATEEEIRKAYRRLALRWHPDRNPGHPEAEERFREVSEAYAVLIDATRRRDYDGARRAGAPYESRGSREDLFRDLFADPRASAIFEELAREFERTGMQVDRHYFHRTLFGGRAVVTGRIFIITPLTPVFTLFRLARAALRVARAVSSGGAPEPRALPRPPGFRDVVVGMGRWLLGLPPGTAARAPAERDLTVPLRLTQAEAQRGGRKRLTLNRDDGTSEVLVTIPPGIQAGARLRLSGKGRDVPRGRPGDLYLAVEITDES